MACVEVFLQKAPGDEMKKFILCIFIFLILSAVFIAFTYPLILNPGSHITGFFSSDENFAPLWEGWRLKYAHKHSLSFSRTDFIAYPFGVDMYGSGLVNYFWNWLFRLSSIVTSAVITYNLVVFLNIVLSGLITYSLAYFLTKSVFAALFSAIVFAFCPYQMARAWQHLGLTFNELMPLSLFAAILIKERYSKSKALLFVLSIFLLFSFDWTIMFLSSAMLLSYFIFVLIFGRQERPVFFKRVIPLGLISFLLVLPQFLPVIVNRILHSADTYSSAYNPYLRPFEDLFTQSAKPLSYLLPASVHPVFGRFTEQFIGTRLYGISFTEHTLYLGLLPLLLAVTALRKRRQFCAWEGFYLSFFAFMVLVAWLFSQPPWWQLGSFKLYMPSNFVYKILPMFRAYCRFGIAVMLGVALLAGFGMKFFLQRFKGRPVRAVVSGLFIAIVLFEFWAWPPYKVIDVSQVPGAYSWIKIQPPEAVLAEYPLDTEGPNEMYKYYQTKHEKKIINGTLPGTYANKVARSIARLSEAKTGGTLKWMGVRYVLVHSDGYLNTGLIEDSKELERIPLNKGLRFVRGYPAEECPDSEVMCARKSGPIDVYEVVAAPVKPEEAGEPK